MCLNGGKNPSKPGDASKAACPPSDPIDKAIEQIRASKWARTAEGKKVLAKIEALRKAGKVRYAKLPAGTLGQWNGSEILIPEGSTDVDFIASSVLVHEGTHALNEEEIPASKSKFVIDEEMRTNTNELDYYEEQRANGYRSSELERRRNARSNGTLRDDVRSRYPGLPEHL